MARASATMAGSRKNGNRIIDDGGKGEDMLRLNLTLGAFEALRGELVALRAFLVAIGE